MKTVIFSFLVAIAVCLIIATLTGPAFASNDIVPGTNVHTQRSEYPAMTVTVHNGNILLAAPPQVLFSSPILGYGTLQEFDGQGGLPCHDAIPRPEPPALRASPSRSVGVEGGSQGQLRRKPFLEGFFFGLLGFNKLA